MAHPIPEGDFSNEPLVDPWTRIRTHHRQTETSQGRRFVWYRLWLNSLGQIAARSQCHSGNVNAAPSIWAKGRLGDIGRRAGSISKFPRAPVEQFEKGRNNASQVRSHIGCGTISCSWSRWGDLARLQRRGAQGKARFRQNSECDSLSCSP
jgi:hypothetical protein